MDKITCLWRNQTMKGLCRMGALPGGDNRRVAVAVPDRRRVDRVRARAPAVVRGARAAAVVLGADVALVDSAEATAEETSAVLIAKGLQAPPSDPDQLAHRFVASDAPAQFLRLGQRFLGAAIERVETVTLG